MMPNKTIYIAESDLALFERAQTQAGGNLSAAIAQALRNYVTEPASDSGEVILQIVVDGIRTRKRFRGQLITVQRRMTHDNKYNVVTRVYRTEKGRFVVWSRFAPDNSYHNWSDPSTWKDEWWRNNESRMEVYETLEALQGQISDELYAQVARIVQTGSDIEDLDI